LGPNGAGKTTTIKMMSGLLKPDSGKVTIGNSDNRKSIGICPQHIVIWDNLTCLEQITFLGKMYDMPSDRVRERANELLEALGLYSVKDRLARYLSGGMQRRLNIALALVHSPDIVFLDEPQAGLDPQSRVLVREFIRTIRETTTVVLTTHDMEEAEKLSDRICIIDKGKVIILGTAEEITLSRGFEDLVEIDVDGDIGTLLESFGEKELIRGYSVSGSRITFKSTDPLKLVKVLLTTISEHGLKIKNLQMRKQSLEDIFINLTGRRLRE